MKFNIGELGEKLNGTSFSIVMSEDGTFCEFDTGITPTLIPLEDVLKHTNTKTFESKEYIGYLGGSYEDLGLWDNKEDAERGIVGGERLHELLSEFDGKKVKITVEEIE